MAKKKRKAKRRRTTSEKVIIVLGIIIAVSMIMSMVFGLRGSRTDGSSALPEDDGLPIALVVIGMDQVGFMSTIGVEASLFPV